MTPAPRPVVIAVDGTPTLRGVAVVTERDGVLHVDVRALTRLPKEDACPSP